MLILHASKSRLHLSVGPIKLWRSGLNFFERLMNRGPADQPFSVAVKLSDCSVQHPHTQCALFISVVSDEMSRTFGNGAKIAEKKLQYSSTYHVEHCPKACLFSFRLNLFSDAFLSFSIVRYP